MLPCLCFSVVSHTNQHAGLRISITRAAAGLWLLGMSNCTNCFETFQLKTTTYSANNPLKLCSITVFCRAHQGCPLQKTNKWFKEEKITNVFVFSERTIFSLQSNMEGRIPIFCQKAHCLAVMVLTILHRQLLTLWLCQLRFEWWES